MTIASQFLFEAGLHSQDKKESREEENIDDNVRYEDDYSQSSPDSGQTFAVGMLVSHKKFGLGRVKEFHNLGDNGIIVVQFKSGQVKPLMLKYANLSIVE